MAFGFIIQVLNGLERAAFFEHEISCIKFLCSSQNCGLITERQCNGRMPGGNEVTGRIADDHNILRLNSLINQRCLHQWINQIIFCPSTGEDAEVDKVTCHKDREQNEDALKENRGVPVCEVTTVVRPCKDCLQTYGRGDPPIRLECRACMKEAATRTCKRKDNRHHYE